MYGSRYMGYNYSPLDNRLEEAMKSASGKKISNKSGANVSAANSNTASPANLNHSGANKSELSNSLNAKDLTGSMPHSMSASQLGQNHRKSSTQVATPHALLTFKNNLFGELTRAIQSVQKAFLDKENSTQSLTNSDYQVHELCQQFDYVFLFGLKEPDEAYWKVILEFTHRNVIAELNNLLNVTTNFGKGRAWLYHALNDNLMESYLRCFIDNKKLVNRFYKKDASLIGDDQAITILVTLVAGLENVQFKLQNDVPYLDHSCWPTHLNIKRHVVDAILNSSTPLLSQFIDLNSTFETLPTSFSFSNPSKLDTILSSNSSGTASAAPNQRETNNPRLKKNLKKAATSTTGKHKTYTRNNHHHHHSSSQNQANNISLDNTNSTTSSTNNLSENNLNDESASETSGRFTGASNTLNYEDGMSPNLSNNELYKHFEGHLKKDEKRKPSNRNNVYIEDTTDEMYDDEEEDLDSNYDSKSIPKQPISSSLIIKSTFTPPPLAASNLSQSVTKHAQNNDEEIENEIDKLRIENKKTKSKNIVIKHNGSDNTVDTLVASETSSSFNGKKNLHHKNLKDENLLATSLKAANNFDKKLHEIENYSQIIENATLNMDACVKDMNIVYENYDNKLRCESSSIEDLITKPLTNQKEPSENVDMSVYDLETKKEEENQIKKTSSSPSLLESPTSQKKLTSRNSLTDPNDLSSIPTNSTSYLDVDLNNVNEVKQELKIDNNTKLMLMIEIFQNGQNEELVKIFHATRGHSQGEVESLNILISSFGVYFLIRKEITDEVINENNLPMTTNGDSSSSNGTSKISNKFRKESFINYNQMDYIEVALCDQAIHFMCINKRQNCWITTASRMLTKNILESIELGRSQNMSLKFPKLSVFHEAMQQKLAINKFIAKEENLDPHDIEIKNYSLVYWEDQTSAVNHLIHKEGYLFFYNKSSGSSTDWKKAYYVLKNDVLTQYRSQNDKRPSQVIKLNGEDFSGCRKNTKSSKPHTIELILSDSNILYLSAKSEAEASDWLQCFCKIISLGNLHTDVPTSTCLPCCSITTNNKLFFCHEDLNTGFYRLLETIKMQEINRISFDNENPYYCVLHDDSDPKKNRYWFVYFIDERERNEFITCFKNSWDIIFQIPLTVEKCKSSEMRKRCIRSVKLIHKLWDWDDQS